ncbi:hypothetical protein [Pseudofrankia sp. BMG5.37]|uniref:hypothetical protein n=1 Tax=Pseudofrankia sp. BMG5.37 TaxID=3050035 RepID=UPI002893DC59|nr:hypothetical protein [Pseudofrankia sp. BMG5.37]MDT3445545.1 hypothetical protein [Pseudofrankia sp. BMG5.37]
MVIKVEGARGDSWDDWSGDDWSDDRRAAGHAPTADHAAGGRRGDPWDEPPPSSPAVPDAANGWYGSPNWDVSVGEADGGFERPPYAPPGEDGRPPPAARSPHADYPGHTDYTDYTAHGDHVERTDRILLPGRGRPRQPEGDEFRGAADRDGWPDHGRQATRDARGDQSDQSGYGGRGGRTDGSTWDEPDGSGGTGRTGGTGRAGRAGATSRTEAAHARRHDRSERTGRAEHEGTGRTAGTGRTGATGRTEATHADRPDRSDRSDRSGRRDRTGRAEREGIGRAGRAGATGRTEAARADPAGGTSRTGRTGGAGGPSRPRRADRDGRAARASGGAGAPDNGLDAVSATNLNLSIRGDLAPARPARSGRAPSSAASLDDAEATGWRPGTGDMPARRPRRPPPEHRPIARTVKTLVLVGVASVGVSLGRQLALPGDASLQIRISDWARDHRLGFIVEAGF